jgi:serine/threonine protein kinase
MKVVESVKMGSKRFADAIIQETLLLSKLNHENIIKVVDFYKVDGGDFVSVMEYRDSLDLHKIVTQPERIKKKNKRFAD